MDSRKHKIDAYKKMMEKTPSQMSEPGSPALDSSAAADAAGKKAQRGESGSSKTSCMVPPDSTRELIPGAAVPFQDPSDTSRSTAEGLLKVAGKENPYRKMAKFLLLIGKDEAAKVLRHFNEEEVERITREISQIKRIDPLEAEQLLNEFHYFKKQSPHPKGGIVTARTILTRAFGQELGRSILNRSVPLEEQKLFSFLQDMEPAQLYQLLRTETPAVVAVLFPFLQAEKVSRLLEMFEPEFRTQLLRRVARKDKVSREVLLQMEEALREKIRKQGTPVQEVEIDGKTTLAEILKYMDITQEQKILEGLEEEAPLLAEEMKDRLFTMDVLEDMDDRDLQRVFRSLSEKDIALLLKGKADSIRGRVLSNLSERRRILVSEEYRFLGAVPKKDVDKATKEFLESLKRMEKDGEIVIHRRGDIVY